MREIIYRGKRVDNGKWVHGGLYVARDGKAYIICGGTHIACSNWDNVPLWQNDWHEVDPATVGQFTGLCDRKGNKIYEGDIVGYANKSSGKVEGKYIVFWNNDSHFCGFCVREYGFDYSLASYVHADYFIHGNVHDNPELLRGGDKCEK